MEQQQRGSRTEKKFLNLSTHGRGIEVIEVIEVIEGWRDDQKLEHGKVINRVGSQNNVQTQNLSDLDSTIEKKDDRKDGRNLNPSDHSSTIASTDVLINSRTPSRGEMIAMAGAWEIVQKLFNHGSITEKSDGRKGVQNLPRHGKVVEKSDGRKEVRDLLNQGSLETVIEGQHEIPIHLRFQKVGALVGKSL